MSNEFDPFSKTPRDTHLFNPRLGSPIPGTPSAAPKGSRHKGSRSIADYMNLEVPAGEPRVTLQNPTPQRVRFEVAVGHQMPVSVVVVEVPPRGEVDVTEEIAAAAHTIRNGVVIGGLAPQLKIKGVEHDVHKALGIPTNPPPLTTVAAEQQKFLHAAAPIHAGALATKQRASKVKP